MKMYVLVRKDMPKTWYPVQACHAVAEYMMHNKTGDWNNGTMVLLGVENERDLQHW
jgi:peptidyl-tRNA hydrolase